MKKLFILAILLITTPCFGAPPTRTNTYVSLTTIRSADVTANEVTLYNYLQAGVDSFADGSIIGADFADGAVTGIKIFDGTITNADINSSAAIAYSKLSLTNSIVNADINSAAAIAGSKLAEITEDDKVDFTALNVASEAQGDIMYRNATGWTRLGAGTDGQFLETNGAGANPQWTTNSSLSNVLFLYSGQVEDQGTGLGEIATSSLNPTATAGTYRFLQGYDNTLVTKWRTKWTKIAGVSTITVYVHAWTRGTGAAAGTAAVVSVDVGGQSGSVTGTTLQATPEWLNFTIDVSSLTNGTNYDVIMQLRSAVTGGTSDGVFIGNMIAFGS